MMKEFQGRKMDTVFVLMVFCVFAASVLLLLTLGANAYKTINGKSLEMYDERTCLSYIWTKVKGADAAGKVYLDDFRGLPTLCLEEEYDTVTYRTVIYLYDGHVRELFSEEGLDFPPEAGAPLFKADSLAFEALDNGLIRVTVNSGSLIISPRGKTGLELAG